MQDLLDHGLFFAQNNIDNFLLLTQQYKETLLYAGYATAFVEAIDLIGGVAPRLEMFNELRNMKEKDMENNNIYSSVCFYLKDNDYISKIPRHLPLTFIMNKIIRHYLKDKTYNEIPVLDIIDASTIPEDVYKNFTVFKSEGNHLMFKIKDK